MNKMAFVFATPNCHLSSEEAIKFKAEKNCTSFYTENWIDRW